MDYRGSGSQHVSAIANANADVGGVHRMKWTLDNLGDDSDSEESTLPQPKEISRLALAADDFDTHKFLLDHASFRSLQDVHATVREWELKLQQELLSTVNSDFDDFVASVDSIKAGEPPLEAIRRDIVKFENQAASQAENFEKLSSALSQELRTHEQLSKKESQGQRLLYMFNLLEDLEIAVPEASIDDHDTLVTLAKLYVALSMIAEEMHDVKAVHVLRISFQGVHSELAKKINESIAQVDNKEARLELLQAREYMLSA